MRSPYILILAHSAEAAEVAANSLARMERLSEMQVRIQIAVVGDQSSPDFGSGLVAVLLVLERAGFDDPRYGDAIGECCALVARRDDFRLFLCGYPDGESGIQDLISHPSLADLVDTVQIGSIASPEVVAEDVARHLHEIEDLRKEILWRRLRRSVTATLGWVVAAVQALCAVAAIVFAVSLPVWDPEPQRSWMAGHEPAIAVLCGIASFAWILLGIFVYSRYGFWLLGMHGQRLGVFWAGLFSFLGPPTLGMIIRLKGPYSWFVLGLALGAVLEAVRRGAWQERRAGRSADVTRITRRHQVLPQNILEAAGPCLLPPLTCPLLPVRHPRVFLSYHRGSAWAEGLSRQLRESLATHGVRAFRDQDDLRMGSAWRRHLNRSLSRADLLIALVDASTVRCSWPAAELEAALAGKRSAGSPEILVLADPQLPEPDRSWLPVFRAVFINRREFPLEAQPRIIQVGDQTLQTLLFQIQPNAYSSSAVLPARLALWLQRFWLFPSFVINGLGSFVAPVLGNLVLLGILVALFFRQVDSRAFLARHGLLDAAFGLVGLCLGYELRLFLATAFELREKDAPRIFKAHRNGAAGLALLALLLGSGASPLALGWGAVLAAVSWAHADGFIERESQRDPAFLRPFN